MKNDDVTAAIAALETWEKFPGDCTRAAVIAALEKVAGIWIEAGGVRARWLALPEPTVYLETAEGETRL